MFDTKLSKLNVESCRMLKVVKCSKLSYQSWKLLNIWKLPDIESCQTMTVVECWGCWIFKVESWKLSNIKVVECWKLKVVEYCESVEYWKFFCCCLLTSFQRRSYCTQSDIKRIKRSEELRKVIYSKRNSTSSRLLF